MWATVTTNYWLPNIRLVGEFLLISGLAQKLISKNSNGRFLSLLTIIELIWLSLNEFGLHQRSRTMAPLSPAPRMSPDPRIPTWNWTTFGYFDKVCLSAWSCGCWGCSEESASIINITFQFFEIIKFPYRSKLPQNKRLIFILSHKLELQLQKHTYDHNIIEDDPVLYHCIQSIYLFGSLVFIVKLCIRNSKIYLAKSTSLPAKDN